MPRSGNSNLFRCFRAWRLAKTTVDATGKVFFLACFLYGALCRVPETAPPPTPSLKKGGGFTAVSGRGVWQK